MVSSGKRLADDPLDAPRLNHEIDHRSIDFLNGAQLILEAAWDAGRTTPGTSCGNY